MYRGYLRPTRPYVLVSSLQELATETGRSFGHLFEARERTQQELDDRRKRLSQLQSDADVTVVLMGSWGRQEVTAESDDDFIILVNGPRRSEVRPLVEEVRGVLDRPPSPGGPFAAHVFCDDLIDRIGPKEDNKNLTRRMLFMLESLPATQPDIYEQAWSRVLRCYLDESTKDFRVPRFFLNDTIRYWRQMCVDFAGKERDTEKWGLQNAKLRLSRKALFAGGLLPILEAASYPRAEMYGFLAQELATPPTDRIARAFLLWEAADPGARTLTIYNEFLRLLGDRDYRDQLKAVTRETADTSPEFNHVRDLATGFEQGLLALLFETDLHSLVREVGIF